MIEGDTIEAEKKSDKIYEIEYETSKKLDEIGKSSEENQESILREIKDEISIDTQNTKGLVEKISRVNNDTIEMKVSHDSGEFTESFRLPKEDTESQSNRLYRLLKYKGIDSNMFLDLEGETVPIDSGRYKTSIIVPKNFGIVPSCIFALLLPSIKYKLAKYNKVRRNYTLTMGGYFVFTTVSIPILFGISRVSKLTSSQITSFPFDPYLTNILDMIWSLSYLSGGILLMILAMAAIWVSIYGSATIAHKIYGIMKSQLWPL